MREPQRWLSSRDLALELRVVLGRVERPRPPSPEQTGRLVSHLSCLSVVGAARTAITTGLVARRIAAVATVALTGWVVHGIVGAPRVTHASRRAVVPPMMERMTPDALARRPGAEAPIGMGKMATLERHRRELFDGRLAVERGFLRVPALKRLGRVDARDASAEDRPTRAHTANAPLTR